MNSELLTVTGKPISVGTGIRLPITLYQRAKARAQREDVKLNRLLCDLIAEALDAGQEGRDQGDKQEVRR